MKNKYILGALAVLVIAVGYVMFGEGTKTFKGDLSSILEGCGGDEGCVLRKNVSEAQAEADQALAEVRALEQKKYQQERLIKEKTDAVTAARARVKDKKKTAAKTFDKLNRDLDAAQAVLDKAAAAGRATTAQQKKVEALEEMLVSLGVEVAEAQAYWDSATQELEKEKKALVEIQPKLSSSRAEWSRISVMLDGKKQALERYVLANPVRYEEVAPVQETAPVPPDSVAPSEYFPTEEQPAPFIDDRGGP